MKKFMVLCLLVLMATPAFAWVKVTNLSGKPQRVTFSMSGGDITRVVAPDRTEMFVGTEGMLALNDPATIAQAKAAKPGPAGALLGDVVAANRTSRIPTTNGDTFVIWPDGRMLIQSSRALRPMF
jgi:hypothetical protein